jgi:hypothetical protein
VAPPGLTVTRYPVNAGPPFVAAGSKFTSADWSAALAETFWGALGSGMHSRWSADSTCVEAQLPHVESEAEVQLSPETQPVIGVQSEMTVSAPTTLAVPAWHEVTTYWSAAGLLHVATTVFAPA